MLTRDDFIRPMQRTFQVATLRDGRKVCLRNLNALEIANFRAAPNVKTDKGYDLDVVKLKAQDRRIVTLCVVDGETHEPFLSEQDLVAMGKADGAFIDEVATLCRLHCKLIEAEEAGDDAEKNSEATGDSASPTV